MMPVLPTSRVFANYWEGNSRGPGFWMAIAGYLEGFRRVFAKYLEGNCRGPGFWMAIAGYLEGFCRVFAK
jgi:hypothetical protein